MTSSVLHRWSWAEADQIQIEIGEFEFLFLLEPSRRGKNLTKKILKNFFNSRKNMRNHLWVIWWVIHKLNLLVGDWWWIMAMIRQLKLPNKTCRGQKLINKRKLLEIYFQKFTTLTNNRFTIHSNPTDWFLFTEFSKIYMSKIFSNF